MKIVDIIARLRPRRPARAESFDITRRWAVRDWADLPTHHPRSGN